MKTPWKLGRSPRRLPWPLDWIRAWFRVRQWRRTLANVEPTQDYYAARYGDHARRVNHPEAQ